MLLINFILSALKIIIMLGFLVFIHEGGHFFVAKLFKIKVNEFAIGFGPKIITKEKGETVYTIRLIPLGGFVNLEGEDKPSRKEGSFSKASITKRILIVAAGAIVNIIFGILTYFILVSSLGNFYSTTVDYTIENYAAQENGIIKGDQIIKINNKNVQTRDEVSKLLNKFTNNEEITVTILRNNEKLDLKLIPTIIEDENTKIKYAYLGIVFEQIENSISNNLYYGFIDTKDFALSIIQNLKELFTQKPSIDQMTGIVGISDIVVQTKGVYEYIYIVALISLSLGITNLLPLPPLDGGKIIIYIIEAIRKKPLKEETELRIQSIGFSLLIVLSIYVTYNDILKIFRR